MAHLVEEMRQELLYERYVSMSMCVTLWAVQDFIAQDRSYKARQMNHIMNQKYEHPPQFYLIIKAKLML